MSRQCWKREPRIIRIRTDDRRFEKDFSRGDAEKSEQHSVSTTGRQAAEGTRIHRRGSRCGLYADKREGNQYCWVCSTVGQMEHGGPSCLTHCSARKKTEPDFRLRFDTDRTQRHAEGHCFFSEF